MTSPLRLYELAGADDAWRFSPYCWRARLALAHKELPVETVPWRFTEKDAIAFSGQQKTPVLVDGDNCIVDSWEIAQFLETRYPERPSLFGGSGGLALTRFIEKWATEVLHPALARVILPDLFEILHEKDQGYFRKTREAAFGTSIEALAEQRDASLAKFQGVLSPLRSTLAAQPFMAGDAPAYADHIAFGAFQWARVSSPQRLVSADDPITAWCDRMLDAYGGIARETPARQASASSAPAGERS
jgi:glutathione S-transferase